MFQSTDLRDTQKEILRPEVHAVSLDVFVCVCVRFHFIAAEIVHLIYCALNRI